MVENIDLEQETFRTKITTCNFDTGLLCIFADWP